MSPANPIVTDPIVADPIVTDPWSDAAGPETVGPAADEGDTVDSETDVAGTVSTVINLCAAGCAKMNYRVTRTDVDVSLPRSDHFASNSAHRIRPKWLYA